jgi:hypothetical protein
MITFNISKHQELNLTINFDQRIPIFDQDQETLLIHLFTSTPIVSRFITSNLVDLYKVAGRARRVAGQQSNENQIEPIDQLIDEQKDKKFKVVASEVVDGDDEQFVCPINWNDRKSFGFFTFDIQNNVDQLDDNLKRIYELDRPIDPSKQNLYREWTKLIVYEHVALLHHAHDRAYQTGIYSVKFQVKLPHSGNQIWIQCCGNVLYDENKKPQFLIGVAGIVKP